MPSWLWRRAILIIVTGKPGDAFPQKFEPQIFAIAVAELGEGASAQSTDKTREISSQVYEHLCLAIHDEFIARADIDPCANQNQTPVGQLVQVRRVGVIPDSETAQEYGTRIGADVVIWGQILRSERGGATIRFQVLENFDRAVNPEFPLVLPVTVRFTEVVIKELDLEGDPIELKKLIAEQSAMIFFAVGPRIPRPRFPACGHSFRKGSGNHRG
jgi:hypothetical protein